MKKAPGKKLIAEVIAGTTCKTPAKLRNELVVFKQMLFKPKNIISGGKKGMNNFHC